MEQVILDIPEEVATSIRNGSTEPLSRRLLELAAVRAYEDDLITEHEVMEMLGFKEREELYEFFKRYNVQGASYTAEDGAALEDLLRQHNR